MKISEEIKTFIKNDVVERFCRYVQIHTTSNAESRTKPSAERELVILELLEKELKELGLADVVLDKKGFIYAVIPTNSPDAAEPPTETFCLVSHVDTSPDQPGANVKPVIHKAWSGKPILFADDPELTLTAEDCTELSHFKGEDIITASGLTLLGADNKAGVAEIMSLVAALQKFPELKHGEIKICFTTDEEIGRGIEGINVSWLPQYCYTVDGGYPGELETECFDAWRVKIKFQGRSVHPGYGYKKLVNAAWASAHFLAELPWEERPERTRDREGFYHLVEQRGNADLAEVTLIVRDFDKAKNEDRLAFIRKLCFDLREAWPGLAIDIDENYQYCNMYEIIKDHPLVVDRAREAITDTGIFPIMRPIRGGTDGSKLTVDLNKPTPNIFAGGMLFHSKKEWVAVRSMMQAVETLIHLARRWGAMGAAPIK